MAAPYRACIRSDRPAVVARVLGHLSLCPSSRQRQDSASMIVPKRCDLGARAPVPAGLSGSSAKSEPRETTANRTEKRAAQASSSHNRLNPSRCMGFIPENARKPRTVRAVPQACLLKRTPLTPSVGLGQMGLLSFNPFDSAPRKPAHVRAWIGKGPS